MENVMPSFEAVTQMAWSYLLLVAERNGGTREGLQQLSVPPETVPNFSWTFFLGTTVQQLVLRGATEQQVRAMFEDALQKGLKAKPG